MSEVRSIEKKDKRYKKGIKEDRQHEKKGTFHWSEAKTERINQIYSTKKFSVQLPTLSLTCALPLYGMVSLRPAD